jgi:hypothetical protein
VIERLAEVYKNDAQSREQKMDPQARLAYHQEHSGPLMEKLEQWCHDQLDERLVEPNSGLGEAIGYMLPHWKALTLFLKEPTTPKNPAPSAFARLPGAQDRMRCRFVSPMSFEQSHRFRSRTAIQLLRYTCSAPA